MLHATRKVRPAQAFRQRLSQRLNVEGRGQALNARTLKELGHRTAVQPGGDAELDQRKVVTMMQGCHFNRPRDGVGAGVSCRKQAEWHLRRQDRLLNIRKN